MEMQSMIDNESRADWRAGFPEVVATERSRALQ